MIDFHELVTATEPPDLPESFYQHFVFSIIISGKDLTYRVRRREDALSGGHLVSAEELLALSDESSYQACLADLGKAGVGRSKEKPIENIKKATSCVDHIHCIKTMEVQTENERQIQAFLIRCYSFGVVPEFLAKRAKNTGLWLSAKRPSSILFPVRFENGFYLTSHEMKTLKPFLPECILESNKKWNIETKGGDVFVLPPAPSSMPWVSSERRCGVIAACRESRFPFAPFAVAMANWSKNIRPDRPPGDTGKDKRAKENVPMLRTLKEEKKLLKENKIPNPLKRKLENAKRKVRRRIYEAALSFSEDEGRIRLDEISRPDSFSSKFLHIAKKIVESDSPELLAIGLRKVPFLTEFAKDLLSMPITGLCLLKARTRLRMYSGSVVIRSRLERWGEKHKGFLRMFESFHGEALMKAVFDYG